MSVFYNGSTQPQSVCFIHFCTSWNKRHFHTTDVCFTLTSPELALFWQVCKLFRGPNNSAPPDNMGCLQVIPVQLAYRVKASRFSRESKKKVKPKTGSVPNRGHESKTGSEPLRGMELFHDIVLLYVVQLDMGRLR